MLSLHIVTIYPLPTPKLPWVLRSGPCPSPLQLPLPFLEPCVTQLSETDDNVQCGTDIINAGTSCCNVMFITNNAGGSSSPHHFLYVHILGVYHTNVIYTGPGMWDNKPCCFDFLWVQWFEAIDPASSGWSTSTLDTVRFPPMHLNSSFSFVDPKDVLCGCHILLAFLEDKWQADGVSVSHCAKDGMDYHLYIMLASMFKWCVDFDTDSFELLGSLIRIYSCITTGA